jgi:sarcosine oxidase
MKNEQSYDVAVVGAGAFGAWTAHVVRDAGADVILIDQYGAANKRASSGGETRIIRTGYGPDEIYTRSAARSLDRWRDLGKRMDQTLFHHTGVLWLAREQDAYSMSTLATFERTGVPFEKLTAVELERRFPQIKPGPGAWAILESNAGVLMAKQGIGAVVEAAKRNGVHYVEELVLAPGGGSRLESVSTSRGSRIAAQKFVFACGPWLPKMFPEIVGELIHVTRQEVFYFGSAPGDRSFSPPEMPALIDFNDLIYAIPDIAGSGFKIALDIRGPEFDPDHGDRNVTVEGLDSVRNYLEMRIPQLANAPVLGSEVCQYENSTNGDFLIDRHPMLENVWLVGGGSGHGFKHGPAVGEYVSGLISGGGDLEPRFSLASKGNIRGRTVY